MTARAIQGDCLEILPKLPDASVDMVFADLPYGTTRNRWDSVLPLSELWDQLLRVAKENAALVFTAQTPFDKVLGASRLDLLRYEWVWEKTSATGHLNARRAPMKAHENILVFYRRLPTYNPQMTHGHPRKVSVANRSAGQSSNYGMQQGLTAYDSTSRYPRSVQTFPKDVQTSALHPTQKPVALVEYMIRTYTNRGDTVLDPTAGVLTTAVAAEAAGRNSICVEKSPAYVSTGLQRLKEVGGGV